MTNNEKLKLICTEIAEYKRTTNRTTNKRCIEKYYNKSIKCSECLADILIDFPLISLHESLNEEGFLIKYKSLSKIIVELKKQKNTEHKTEKLPRETNQPNKGDNKKPEIKKQTIDQNMSIRAMRLQSEREYEEQMKNQLHPEMQAILDEENERQQRRDRERMKNENSSNFTPSDTL